MATLAKGPSRAEQMLAQSGGMVESIDDYHDEEMQPGERAKVAHIRPGVRRVWFLTPNGSVSRDVSAHSLGGAEGVLSHGGSPVCHDCQRDDCGKGVNDCVGRPKRQYRKCPVTSCGKVIFDPKPTGQYLQQDGMTRYTEDGAMQGDEDDGLVIKNDEYTESSPEARTKTMMDAHIIGYHADDAVRLGLITEAQRLAIKAI